MWLIGLAMTGVMPWIAAKCRRGMASAGAVRARVARHHCVLLAALKPAAGLALALVLSEQQQGGTSTNSPGRVFYKRIKPGSRASTPLRIACLIALGASKVNDNKNTSKRHPSCRWHWLATAPGNAWGVQALVAGLRQANDLLPTQSFNDVWHKRCPHYYD